MSVLNPASFRVNVRPPMCFLEELSQIKVTSPVLYNNPSEKKYFGANIDTVSVSGNTGNSGPFKISNC